MPQRQDQHAQAKQRQGELSWQAGAEQHQYQKYTCRQQPTTWRATDVQRRRAICQRLAGPTARPQQRGTVRQQRRRQSEHIDGVAQPDRQAGLRPLLADLETGQPEVALQAERHQGARHQHSEGKESEQVTQASQGRIERLTPQQPPAQGNGGGFRQGIERRPRPGQAPQRHTDQGIEIQRRQHPRSPPQAQGKAEHQGQVTQRYPVTQTGRQGNPGCQMENRQRQPPGPVGQAVGEDGGHAGLELMRWHSIAQRQSAWQHIASTRTL